MDQSAMPVPRSLHLLPQRLMVFLVQEDRLQSQSPNLVEVELPLSDVLYDAKKVGDVLPVELVWELNSIGQTALPRGWTKQCN